MQRLLVWCPSAPQVVTIRQSPGKASQHLKWRYGSHLKDRFPLQEINLDHRFRCAWTDWDSIGWEIVRISLYVCHDCDINIVCASDTLFTKRRDVLPPHLVKPQSRHIWRLFPLPPGCLSNFRAIRPLEHRISPLQGFTRFGGKTSYRLVNRGRDAVC